MRQFSADLIIISTRIGSPLFISFSAQISCFISIMESASSQQQRNLSDLPIGALSHVSNYLPSLPSRALFAVALNYSRDIDSNSAIVGDQKDVLDFGNIEKELAAKLTDDDVRNVLLAINAVSNLKTLRLTNLLNITGICLEPMRGSTTIEKIDLSLVGDHESPDLSPVPPISCMEVLPILDSIIDMVGSSSLKLLTFPKKWRKERSTESEFHAFVARYNALLCSRVVPCLRCDDNLDERAMVCRFQGDDYGTQKFTCHDCMRHYCGDCSEEGDGGIFCMSALCGFCNRQYCFNCSREWQCISCNGWFCVDCMDMKQCADCNDYTCLNCAPRRACLNNSCEGKVWCAYCAQNTFNLCENCNAQYCNDCCDSNTNAINCIDYCDECEESLCGKCRVYKCKDGSDCRGCYQFAFPALLEDKEKKIGEMQAAIDKLELKVKDLSGELEGIGIE